MIRSYKLCRISMSFNPLRHAFTLLEVTVAAAMLAVLMATSMQMLRVVSTHQRAATRRVAAIETVQAVADQISNVPWDKLSAETAKQVPIPAPFQSYLPGAKLLVALEDEAAPAASKRIHIELTWNGPDGQPVAPARLTTWVFPERPTSE